MYPLTSAGTVKALLPVGNRPLISYPLRNLAEAGIKKCIVVSVRAHKFAGAALVQQQQDLPTASEGQSAEAGIKKCIVGSGCESSSDLLFQLLMQQQQHVLTASD